MDGAAAADDREGAGGGDAPLALNGQASVETHGDESCKMLIKLWRFAPAHRQKRWYSSTIKLLLSLEA
jgi:hypothetical protein